MVGSTNFPEMEASLPQVPVLQGFLAHKKQRLTRTLHKDHAQRPLVVLGEGLFLMSEVPLYTNA